MCFTGLFALIAAFALAGSLLAAIGRSKLQSQIEKDEHARFPGI